MVSEEECTGAGVHREGGDRINPPMQEIEGVLEVQDIWVGRVVVVRNYFVTTPNSRK